MQKYKLTLSVEKSVVMAFKRIYEGRNMAKIDKILSKVTDDKESVYTNLERAYLLGKADLQRDECLKRRNKKNQHI